MVIIDEALAALLDLEGVGRVLDLEPKLLFEGPGYPRCR